MNGASTFYKFTINLSNPVPKNAILTLLPPSQISVAAKQGTYVDCEGHGALKSSLLCILTNKRVVVNLELSKSQLDKDDDIELTIYGVGNPKAMKQSGSFEIQILSSDSAYLYQSQNDGITVLNTKPNVIEVVEIQATNSILGADSSYTVEFMPVNSLPDEAIILLSLPDSLTQSISTDLECIGLKNLQVGSLDCSYDQENHEVSVMTGLSRIETSPQLTSFEISGFTNPL